ncbi:conserved hypothetical protein [Methylocella silvestris BL2]|uniref:Uncharacterized protein n=1 Tax=Methylocella silvestris (strain DSM 15510 / CIP 108128 / LMG 27833 / NCIMB 13906 / BL2) TaxID=395965 RepID=B8ETQ7_METSB|nr:hypothetical protein [Methylocella silvestris]ACK52409.1 conserved hypothetical protein [Methylocella silvestris BL2]
MLLEMLSLLALALAPNASPGGALSLGPEFIAAIAERPLQAPFPAATFQPAPRAVSNWRFEAARNLDAPVAQLAKLVAPDASSPRCVKLNNYWCVKKAGWAGEIAADADGHVAFASATEGAVVAAMLLRRYYLVYNLRSAQAILSRWAPAQCGGGALSRGRGGGLLLGALAPRGIGNTLRARWLAAHRPGSALKKTAKGAGPGAPAPKIRVSIIADRKMRMIEAPEIAVGMGERSATPQQPFKLALLEMPSLAPLLAAPSCVDETARIRQYALRAIEGRRLQSRRRSDAFHGRGAPPAPNLPLVMQNMAKVEIGPLAARFDLISAAVETEARREAQARGVPSAAAPAEGK